MPYEKVIELVLTIVLEAMQSQPPEVKAELWKNYVEDVRAWRAFFEKLTPK